MLSVQIRKGQCSNPRGLLQEHTHTYPRARAAARRRGVCVGSASPAALSWPHPTAAGKGSSTGPQLSHWLQAQHCSATAVESLSQREENQQLKIAVYRNNNPRALSTEGGFPPQYKLMKSFAFHWEQQTHQGLWAWRACSWSGSTAGVEMEHCSVLVRSHKCPMHSSLSRQAVSSTGTCLSLASYFWEVSGHSKFSLPHCLCSAATAGLKRGGCTAFRKFHWCVRNRKETSLLIGVGMDSLMVIRLIPPVPRLKYNGANWGHC